MDAALKTKNASPAAKVPEIQKVGIIGAGQMGNGIAHVIALAGYNVAMNDIRKEAVDKAIGIIERNMSRQVTPRPDQGRGDDGLAEAHQLRCEL